MNNALGYDIRGFNAITDSKRDLWLEDEPALLSKPTEAFNFDFCNFEKIYSQKKIITLKATKSGSSAGIIQWLKVNLFNNIEYQNNPAEMYRSGSVSGWRTPVYRFDEPVCVSKGQEVKINASLFEDSVWFSHQK